MVKKFMVLCFVFMLAFYPATISTSAFASSDNDASTSNSEDEKDQESTKENDSEDEENNESDDEDNKNAEDSSEDEESETQDDNEVEENEVSEDNDSEADKNASEEKENSNDEASESSKGSAEASNHDDSSEEQADEDDKELSTTAAEDGEEIDLSQVGGVSEGDITYDVDKGVYILNLTAGFDNQSDQAIEDKWVAFSLPSDVRVAEDLPDGVMQYGTSIVVKVAQTEAGESQRVNKQIALIGQVDEDSTTDLTMFEKDEESDLFTEIGPIGGERQIDFSVMEENPSINLTGSVEGDTEFDSDKAYYYLNLAVDAENLDNLNIDNLYVAFEIPETVQILSEDESPEEVKVVTVNGKEYGAVKLPNAKKGETKSVNYQVPVIGKSDQVVTADSIQLLTFNEDNQYTPVGQADGNINIDYSGMNESWYLTSKSEVIDDYPGVNDSQKGFRFNYRLMNLTLEDVEKVSVEFIVPDTIEIEKPQYLTGGQNIEWDGNVAKVDVENIKGASGYHGYFTAVGKTDLTIDELKETEVKVTFFRDGDKVVKTIQSPFILGKYDKNDFNDPPEKDDEDEEPSKNNDNKDSGNDDGSNDDNTSKGNKDNKDTSTGNGSDADKQSGDNIAKTSNEDNFAGLVEGGNDNGANQNDKGAALPKTATNNYSLVLSGLILITIGGFVLMFRRKTI